MRKIKFVIVLLLSVILTMMTAACGGGSLEAPAGFDIDDENMLSWDEVTGARSYRIQIKSVKTEQVREDSFRPARYNLATLQEGDYEIRVMAVGGSQANVLTSEWSPVLPFHKNYESGLMYELINNNTEYQILRVGSASGDVVIEDVYRGRPVTAIGERAFRASSRLTGIVIGENVRSIGAFAFYNCQMLASVTIPDSVTFIDESAFQGCNALTYVELPNHLDTIPERAFAYCRNLESIKIGAAVENISDSAFYGCSALKEIDLPDSVAYIGENAFASDDTLETVRFGKGLRAIGENAFNNNKALANVTFVETDEGFTIGAEAFQTCPALESIVLPEGLAEIGDHAFAASEKFKEVTLPESLRAIGLGAFNGTELYYSQIDTDDGFVYADDWLVSVSPETRNSIVELNASSFEEGTAGIAASVFVNAQSLETVSLPASIKHIGKNTFYNCPVLFQFTHAVNGLETIGSYSLAYCASLSQLQLQEGLLEIGDHAFYACTTVTSPTTGSMLVPSTVTKIGVQAFAYTRLTADETGVVYAGNWVVGYASNLSSDVTLASSTVGIADYAFSGSSILTNLRGLNNVVHIGEGAFMLCKQLASITFSRNLRVIEPFTFYKCSALYVVDFPTMLESIGDYSFYVCDRLSEVDFSGTNLKSVGSHAFYECTNLRNISLNDGMEMIADYAFYHCASLAELSVPGSVISLGNRAFGRCIGLSSLEIGEGVEYIGTFAFRECSALTGVVLPDSVVTVDDYAFYLCQNLVTLDLGKGVEQIGKYAFFGCGITTLSLPQSLKSIGDAAFKACTRLRVVSLYGSTEKLGANVFFANDRSNLYGLSGLTVYVIGESGESWSTNWNSASRPVIQGCVFSEDGYLLSVTVGEEGVVNGYIWGGYEAPVRIGYEFAGWSERPDATVAEYALNDIRDVASGTTLYAVWTVAEAPSPEIGE